MMVLTSSTAVTSADGTTISYQTCGGGEDVIVVGGSMRSARDYLPLAAVLARQFRVHVIDRRGRGGSGPQGADYTIDKECDDLLAVQARTGATRVFGHSYGGLVVLETARRAHVFTRLAVYEPGVSVAGSIPTGWISRYRQMLAAADPRGAFAIFVQQSGHAPGPVARIPLWYLRAILRVVIRNRQWQHMEPLLASNAIEHEQVHALDDTVTRYATIEVPVLLLGGSHSPRRATMASLDALHHAIAGSTIELLDGLDHNAPDEKAPAPVAHRVLQFLRTPAETS